MELGIKGNETHGDEIIKILEMLGGKNRHEMRGSIYNNYFYYIDDEYKDISYSYIGPDEIKGYEIFSLDEFLEKFPYKVGDKVNIYVQNDDIEGWFDTEVAEITSMRWDPTRCRIAYKMKDINREFCAEDIKSKVIDIAIKTTKDMEEKKINQILLANCDLDEVEIILGDRFELKIEDGKYYAVRKKPTYPKLMRSVIMEERQYKELRMPLDDDDKLATEVTINGNKILSPNGYLIGKITQVDNGMLVEYVKKQLQYPKTYEECCELLGKTKGYQSVSGYKTELLEDLQKLLICRDAYWKLTGEQMGLGKPWEPDWNDLNRKYFISLTYEGISLYDDFRNPQVLAFPTEEMRDIFYENFKDLIEQCKELL